MNKRVKLLLVIILAFQLVFSFSALAKDALIRKFVVTNVKDDIVVFFDLDGAFAPSIRRAIENGIPTTFTFIIKLSRVKRVWFDSSIAELKIFRTIKYDSLKKQYLVTQRIGKGGLVELKRTSDFSEAKRAMKEFKSIPVVKTALLKKGSMYDLRVKAKLDKVKLPFYLEYVLVFVSIWDFQTPWHIERFTY